MRIYILPIFILIATVTIDQGKLCISERNNFTFESYFYKDSFYDYPSVSAVISLTSVRPKSENRMVVMVGGGLAIGNSKLNARENFINVMTENQFSGRKIFVETKIKTIL